MSDEEIVVQKKKSEAPSPRRKPKTIVIPRRAPSIVIAEKKPFIPAIPDCCGPKCTCYPKADPYIETDKLNQCQKSPLTLYELAAMVVDSQPLPKAFAWSVNDVVKWMTTEVRLPQYKESILNNHIDGMRLLMLEDPSKVAAINVKNFEHIKRITSKVRQLYGTEIVRFSRSIGLPPRKPLTHCTWFKARTSPSWGVHRNWTRCDILRWMKILMPEPMHMNHWDLVWYQKPDFPSVKFARIPDAITQKIPIYNPQKETCREYLTPRKFKLQNDITESKQLIWMERMPDPKKPKKPEPKKGIIFVTPRKDSTLYPKKISLTGLSGKEYILAKRKVGTPKFFRN